VQGLSVKVRGTVRGVGFRPFVRQLAEQYELTGWARNSDRQIEIELDGTEAGLERFLRDLRERAPPQVRIDEIQVNERPPSGFTTFEIVESEVDEEWQYVPPDAVDLPFTASHDILACGAQRKSTYCLVTGSKAYLSQDIGDLERPEALEHFEASLESTRRLFQVEPQVIAHDMDPDYMSTHFAHAYPATSAIRVVVQHHHAHVVSAMVDRGLEGPVIGVAYDGGGYGTDGAVWGGEILVADWQSFERAAHVRYAPLLGREAAILHPYRMAAAYVWSLCAASESEFESFLATLPIGERIMLRRQLEAELNTPLTSSCGRLFDAAAAMLGVCREAEYEGQPALELEAIADPQVEDVYPYDIIRRGDGWIIDPAALFRALWCEYRAGRPVPHIAAAFHNSVASFTLATCVQVREARALNQVVLSGGCFRNALLTRRLVDGLRVAGFQVFTHSRVPVDDGGLSLGQAVIAHALTSGSV